MAKIAVPHSVNVLEIRKRNAWIILCLSGSNLLTKKNKLFLPKKKKYKKDQL